MCPLSLKERKEEAQARNENVQIRIYQNTSTEFKDDEPTYRQIGIGILTPPEDPSDPNYNRPENFTYKLLSNKYQLPQDLIFLEEAPYSTLISGISGASESVTIGEETEDSETVPFSAFTFAPDTRAFLSTEQNWTLTIAPSNQDRSLPKNFSTIQVYPGTGKVTVIRP